ncbi:calcium-binding protein [Vannielia sp.]|uniref:calcium-binding protein n=1 Tax=Vannielia sp. TaxID=2813045 RepID=UPI002631A6BE|nr:calcium-binding protein [Vannielia sp.]MDF1872808.1 calcium-binding protein [Vannielia sp.]
MSGIKFIGSIAGAVPGMELNFGSLNNGENGVTLVDAGSFNWEGLNAAGNGLATEADGGNLSNKTSFDFFGTTVKLPDAALDAALAAAEAGETGSAKVYFNNAASFGTTGNLLCTTIDGTTFAFISAQNGAGVAVYQVSTAEPRLTPVGEVTDNDIAYAEGIAAMTVAEVNGETFLYVGSATENGITGYSVTSTGGLIEVEHFGTQQSLPVQTITAMDSATVSGTEYVVAGAMGSSSLTVLAVESDGMLTAEQHLIDSMDTRFGNLTALEVIEVCEGRSLVIAAGADGGFSIFALTPAGELIHLESFEGTAEVPVDRVTSIAATEVGDTLEIFLTSEGDAGVLQFTYDISDYAVAFSITSGSTTGSDAADLLMATTGHSTLRAEGGNDVLVDGDGRDHLYGGAGADIFVLHSGDTYTDRIHDYEFGLDTIDLSSWNMLYSVAQFSIKEIDGGGLSLTWGQDRVEIYPADGSTLTLDDVWNMDFTFMSTYEVERGPLQIAEAEDDPDTGTDPQAGETLMGHDGANTLVGGTGNDTFEGFGGDDIFVSGGGSDTFNGGDGLDIVSYAADDQRVKVNFSNPAQNSGLAGNDSFDSIEGVIGSSKNDTFVGDAGDNYFEGSGGADWLDGGAGNDVLYGGDMSDSLLGRDGDDVLYGGSGNDNMAASDGDDILYGGDGNDGMGGGFGNDALYGGEGDDWMGAGPGHDIMEGNGGDDKMSAGWGSDTLYGGDGDDHMAGSYGHDYIDGGNGNDIIGGGLGKDEIYGGTGNDSVGAGDDDDRIYGNDGHDILNGGNGDDYINGGAGRDTINGGEGDDVMTGGGWADTFQFYIKDAGAIDVITDFNVSQDVISLRFVGGINDSVKFNSLDLSQQGDDVYLDWQDQTIILENVSLSDLSADQFDFV